MSERVKVTVVEFGDRRHYMMQWRDSVTGRKKSKSTKVERTGRAKERKEAERVAAKFEAELREGRYHEPLRVTWASFRERYESEVLPSLADETESRVAGVFNRVERVLNPVRLVDLTEAKLSHLQAEMRRDGLAEPTIKTNLAHIKAALRWAERMGMLARVPKIDMPKRAKGAKVMKGRPITGEEFERMLDKIAAGLAQEPAWRKHKPTGKRKPRPRKPREIRPEVVESWRHYLLGLWYSGLRLSESLELWWDRDDRLCVDLSEEYPMLRIPAECEKGNQDRLLPMAPEFAEFLLAAPEAKRTGRVFNPLPLGPPRGERLCDYRVCEMVARIGKAAGVKVASKTKADSKTGERGELVKYASAHDLRRSFGERWATRVMPTVLQALMRHESIETTLRYYVGRNAQNTAKVLWEAHKRVAAGNTLSNSGEIRHDSAVRTGDSTSDGAKGCEVDPGGFEPPTKGL